MPVKNSQINPSTIVRAARAAGSQPHLASGFQGRCKIATIHAGFGVIRGMSVQHIRVIYYDTTDPFWGTKAISPVWLPGTLQNRYSPRWFRSHPGNVG